MKYSNQLKIENMSRTFNICTQCNKKIATNGKLCNYCIEHNNEEFEKCKKSPYYFAINYIKVGGKPFFTRLTEKEFNEQFNRLT